MIQPHPAAVFPEKREHFPDKRSRGNERPCRKQNCRQNEHAKSADSRNKNCNRRARRQKCDRDRRAQSEIFLAKFSQKFNRRFRRKIQRSREIAEHKRRSPPVVRKFSADRPRGDKPKQQRSRAENRIAHAAAELCERDAANREIHDNRRQKQRCIPPLAANLSAAPEKRERDLLHADGVLDAVGIFHREKCECRTADQHARQIHFPKTKKRFFRRSRERFFRRKRKP